jgi:hypothetical protein
MRHRTTPPPYAATGLDGPLTVVRETTERLRRRRLDSPLGVGELARQLIADDAREHFGVLLLDTKLQLIAWHHVSTGTLSASLVHAREVFGPALRLLGVAALVLGRAWRSSTSGSSTRRCTPTYAALSLAAALPRTGGP